MEGIPNNPKQSLNFNNNFKTNKQAELNSVDSRSEQDIKPQENLLSNRQHSASLRQLSQPSSSLLKNKIDGVIPIFKARTQQDLRLYSRYLSNYQQYKNLLNNDLILAKDPELLVKTLVSLDNDIKTGQLPLVIDNINNNIKDKHTLLNTFSSIGNVAALELVLKHGANIHELDGNNDSALSLANNAMVAKQLLNTGASTNLIDRRNSLNLFDKLLNKHKFEVLKVIFDHLNEQGSSGNYLPKHIADDQLLPSKLVLAKAADSLESSSDKKLAMLDSAFDLLEHKMDTKDENGSNLLQLATLQADTQTTSWLIENKLATKSPASNQDSSFKFDINYQNQHKQTILDTVLNLAIAEPQQAGILLDKLFPGEGDGIANPYNYDFKASNSSIKNLEAIKKLKMNLANGKPPSQSPLTLIGQTLKSFY
jgi:hypothetical protein